MVWPMELRSFTIPATAGPVQVLTQDQDGPHTTVLEAAAADTVIRAAAPLLATLESELHCGLQMLSYNGVSDTLSLIPATDSPLAGNKQELQGLGLSPHLAGLKAIARAILGELRTLSGDTRNRDDRGDPSDPKFWEVLYQADTTGWELGRASPPLANYFANTSPAGLRVLVVGCGRGHEARMLASLGAEVTAIDIAPSAIAQARAIESPQTVDFRLADLFDLRGQLPAFDLIVEHTCFCAIDPARRDEYVAAVADALVPGGTFIGLFFAHGREGGPPFTTTAKEIRERFGDRFIIDTLATAEGSVISRRGDELFARLIRRA